MSIFKLAVLVALCLSVTGCLTTAKEAGYGIVANQLDKYCEGGALDDGVRQTLVDKINEQTKVATLTKVECDQ